MLFWALCVFLFPFVCRADVPNKIEMSDLFQVHGPTCDRYDVDGLRDDAAAITRACVAALEDLKHGAWDGKPREEAWKEAYANRNFKKIWMRNYNRLRNAHLFFGTTLTKESLPKIMREGPSSFSTRDESIIEAAHHIAGRIHSYLENRVDDLRNPRKPFLACSAVCPWNPGPEFLTHQEALFNIGCFVLSPSANFTLGCL